MQYVFLALLFLYGCKKTNSDVVVNDCNSLVSYSNQVKSIFVNNCTSSGCHDGLNYPSLVEYQVAKDANQQIRIAVDRGVMPMNSILSSKDKAAIICWIDNGAQNN
jgi:hypothetical protein